MKNNSTFKVNDGYVKEGDVVFYEAVKGKISSFIIEKTSMMNFIFFLKNTNNNSSFSGVYKIKNEGIFLKKENAEACLVERKLLND